MATLTSFFGGSGADTSGWYNDWGTILPSDAVHYEHKANYTELMPCSSANATCWWRSFGSLHLCDNYFVVFATNSEERNQTEMRAKVMCITDAGCVCSKSSWCCIYGNSCAQPIIAATDGNGYIIYSHQCCNCTRMNRICVNLSSPTAICCNPGGSGPCISNSAKPCCRSGFGNQYLYTGHPGRLFVYDGANHFCAHMLGFCNGTQKFCCEFTCLGKTCSNGNSTALGDVYAEKDFITAHWCATTACLGNATVNMEGVTLFCKLDSRNYRYYCLPTGKVFTQLPDCTTNCSTSSVRNLVYFGYYGTGQNENSNLGMVGCIDLNTNTVGYVRTLNGTAFCNINASQAGRLGGSDTGTCLYWGRAKAVQPNGVMRIDMVSSHKYRFQCVCNCSLPQEGITDFNWNWSYALGPSSCNPWAALQMNAGVVTKDPKVWPMHYPLRLNTCCYPQNAAGMCMMDTNVIGKCWFVTIGVHCQAACCQCMLMSVHEMKLPS